MSSSEFNQGAAHFARHLHQVVGYIKGSMPEDDEMYMIAHRALEQVQKACTDGMNAAEGAGQQTPKPEEPFFPKSKKTKEEAK